MEPNPHNKYNLEDELDTCMSRFDQILAMQIKIRKTIAEDRKKAKYKDELERYNWKAEIPGDPYGVK